MPPTRASLLEDEDEWDEFDTAPAGKKRPSYGGGVSAAKRPAPSAAPSWQDESASWEGIGSDAASWSGGALNPGDIADIKQWVGCTRVGKRIPGTRIVPVKCPFEGALADKAYSSGLLKDTDWFGKSDLLKVCKKQGTPIGFILDLSNTTKYFPGWSPGESGIEYHKKRIPGRTVPERAIMEQCCNMIDEFLQRNPDKHAAIHCTHGLNRTGFLIAYYLMTRADVKRCYKAVKRFETARGTQMDKEYLIEALMDLEDGAY